MARQRIQRPNIELDELLTGNPSIEDVSQFFKLNAFPDEHYLVQAIRKHLLTEEQRTQLFARDITIEQILNGRVQGESNHDFIRTLFADWNTKLGFQSFGT